MLHLGGISLFLVAIAISLSLTFMHLLGRAFKLKPKLTSLLAVGSSICGVSAIIAAKPSIDADDEDASYAIAAILALGAISLFTFPLIGHSLHHWKTDDRNDSESNEENRHADEKDRHPRCEVEAQLGSRPIQRLIDWQRFSPSGHGAPLHRLAG